LKNALLTVFFVIYLNENNAARELGHRGMAINSAF